MENIVVKKRIKSILVHHIFLTVLLILILFAHTLFVSKFSIVIRSLAIVFYICMAIYISEIIFLIRLIYYILSKKICPTLLKIIKNRLLIILSLSILSGISLTYVHWMNYLKLPKYIEECPYNFNLKDIKKLFNNFTAKNPDDYKKCYYRRCFLEDKISKNKISNNKTNDDHVYNYICNYVHDFYSESKNNFITCRYINTITYYENYEEIFYNYLEYCDTYTTFYECEHKYKVEENLYISYKDKCPKKYNKKNYEVIGGLFMLIDVIGVSSIWFVTFLEYNKLLKILNITINAETGNRISPSSLNSTKESSIIIQNGINNNRLTNYQANDLQTETIFYPDLNNVNRANSDKSINSRNTSITNDIHDESNLNSKNELIHIKPDKIQ